ncbi:MULTISPECIES: PadR family transcriptional regulator [Thermococcus]|uniref:ParR family transcriptional regulator n=1 Tax=Thermococcus nautili TaxID=195522 RepID=W8PJ30_9EURY|nr:MULTISPECIES: PadR family transcriptional regulator [Thermococcus]AHL22114.1 ParR family transcriptional regulator [Thermococcus nautili]NJE48651.1 PadR family transcriptional regulator [Thermococcus sp. 9N3]CAI1493837.1 ParR family transcriptional regulator [Thermococcus nautili]
MSGVVATEFERKIIKGLFTVPLKNIILVIVGLKGETHGYEILKELEKFTVGIWKPSHSNLYTLLNKMVEEGLLEPREEYRGKVRRVKYRLTDKGWEYLRTSNDLALRSLYTAISYHERLKKKIEEMGRERKIDKETLREYLELLRQIRDLLDDEIKAIESRLG